MTFWTTMPMDVVRIEGPDSLTYLHSQLSQDIRPLAVGTSAYSLLLQPNGRVEALVRVRRVGEEAFELDVDSGYGDAVVARLQRFKIRVKAELSLVERSVIAIRGEGAGDVDGVVTAWWGDGTAADLVDALQPLTDVAQGTEQDLHAARVRAGWPALGAEIIAGETLPTETGVVSVAVSFTKGCYPGQELVERMDSRGAAAPRSLRRLTVAAGAQPGDSIELDGVAVGVLTSVAGTDALGYVKRGVDAGQQVGLTPTT